MAHFVDVILPIALKKLFTYKISEAEAHFLKPGMRVAVSFGKSKIYTALCYQIHTNEPSYQTKDIEGILDETPIVTAQQLTLWQWISDFYMCSLGEVFKAALPSAFLLESETIVEIDHKDLKINDLTDEEWLVYEALSVKSALTVSEVNQILQKKKTISVLKNLVEKNAVKISEKIYEKYVPKLVKYVRLMPDYQADSNLQALFENLSKAKKQKELLLSFFKIISQDKSPLKAEKLLNEANASAAILKAMVEKGIFEIYYLQNDRLDFSGEISKTAELTPEQQTAFDEINAQFEKTQVVLFQGVTASGKTEIYTKLIEKQLEKGNQSLLLLPEIGITVHLIARLRKHFGDKLAVYHSKYTSNERLEVWNNVLKNSPKAQVIIGVRSSVFLPFQQLGMVIIDEEHDASYRQFDPAPRFQARDTAILFSKIYGAKILLGSATPSVETMHNVKLEKYGFCYLPTRFKNFQLPDIQLIDLKDCYFRKKMDGHFSFQLIEEIKKTLEKGQQVLLLQNKRGYAPITQCKNCGTVPQCPHCDVSLTFHHGQHQLRCHYCGYASSVPKNCMACGSNNLIIKGLGTEQVIEELNRLFPQTPTDRMDQDTTKGKFGYEKILADFQSEETKILVGTQMISKGLDFKNVGLVGVMNADSLIHYPDFRSHERSFQLLTQVAGRAGRSANNTQVFIQTYNTQHPVLQQVMQQNQRDLYLSEISQRQQFQYPPFVRMIKITLKHSDFNKLNEAADWFASALRQVIDNQGITQILGPEFPLVQRIRNEYIKDILVKIPPSQSVWQIKNIILRTENSFSAIGAFVSVRVIYNVD